MDDLTPRWRVAVVVCGKDRAAETGRSSCGAAAGSELRAWLRDSLREHGVKADVMTSTTQCLGVCPAQGTVVSVHALQAGVPAQLVRVHGQEDRALLLERILALACPALSAT